MRGQWLRGKKELENPIELPGPNTFLRTISWGVFIIICWEPIGTEQPGGHHEGGKGKWKRLSSKRIVLEA